MKPRAALYTRYSNDRLQKATSIDDQIRECTEWADAHGYEVAEIFRDEGISGTLVVNRPEYQRMLAEITGPRCRFDAIIVDAQDRLSRDPGDISNLRREMDYRQIKLISVRNNGETDPLLMVLQGAISAGEVKNNGPRVKRGQAGLAMKGKVVCGVAYGYRPLRAFDADGELICGEREIIPEQAEVIRRVFREYAAGSSARTIAAGLNADGIPSPRGGHWNASTISGSAERKNGLLNNEAYIGRVIYNRQSFRKNPANARRIGTMNSSKEWRYGENPALRIVSDDEWNAAIAKRREIKRTAKRPDQARRPKHFLSGLLKCGVCGGPMIIVQTGYFGCSRHKESGSGVCANARRVNRDLIDADVLSKLEENLLADDMVEEYIEERRRAAAEANATAGQTLAELKRKRARLDAACEAAVKAIREGYASRRMKEQMMVDEREIEDLDAQIAAAAKPTVVSLHPHAVAQYRKSLKALRSSLEARNGPEAVAIIRSLVGEIIVTPLSAERHGPQEVRLVGRLEELMVPEVALSRPYVIAAGGGGSRGRAMDIAPGRFGRCPHLPPITWTLGESAVS